MTAPAILITFLLYTSLLFVVSAWKSKGADNRSFFTGNKASPWVLVAYGMIGASLSGVTFISVPGAVGRDGFSYMMMVLGYFVGYLGIIRILLPLYYRLELTSIYTYFKTRYGLRAYKTGAAYFLVSRIIGAAFRLYLVVMVLQYFVFQGWGISFELTTALFILLILLYTFKAGIKTIVWTDTLQTTFMLLSLFLSLYFIVKGMHTSWQGLYHQVLQSDYSTLVVSDWHHPRFFLKQFVAGAFMSVVMTGMDQDMMQKNLTCRSLKDAQKNMFWMSLMLIPINLVFLFLGAALYLYAAHYGLALPGKADRLFPLIALNYLGPAAALTFFIGLIAAAYSSADSALTALTTSFSIDILDLENKNRYTPKQKEKLRKLVHVGMAGLVFLVIVIFRAINNDSVINDLFVMAGYTYGPLLGLFGFGLLTSRRVNDNLVFPVALATPLLSYGLSLVSADWFNGYHFGFELIIINGLLTFVGLYLISKAPAAS